MPFGPVPVYPPVLARNGLRKVGVGLSSAGAFDSNQRTTTSPARTLAFTSAKVTAITSLRAERTA
jgi:hypothetical protein